VPIDHIGGNPDALDRALNVALDRFQTRHSNQFALKASGRVKARTSRTAVT
jgi:hypothetical protein